MDDSESVGIVLPESPGDDVIAHVESERLPTVGGASLEADGLAGFVHPVVRVAPSVGGGADGVGDVPVGGDVLCGGHCLVLSIPGWGLPSLPMTQSCSPVRHGSTLHGDDVLHKIVWVQGIDRYWTHVVYARARTYMYYGRTQVLMIKS